MYSTEIYAQLQNVTYSAAIDRYNALKARFFMEYSIAANQEEAVLIDQVENEIATDITNNPIQDQEQLTAELFQQIADVIKQRLDGSKAVKNIRAQYQSGERGAKAKAERAAQILGQELMSEEELASYVKASLGSKGVGSGFDISDIVNQVRSYRNKLILTRSNASAKSYIRSTKGYYREAIIYKAFSQLGNYVEQLPVISTGAEKNAAQQDTAYDTYIHFFDNIKQGFQALINDNVDIGYGLQVKSWMAPWEEDGISYAHMKYGYSVGSRDTLLAASGLKGVASSLFSWARGVFFLEQNAIQAIGENQVGFVTGANFYWTADLISAFRAMNYFLAFGYSRDKPLSPTVSWQTIPTS